VTRKGGATWPRGNGRNEILRPVQEVQTGREKTVNSEGIGVLKTEVSRNNYEKRPASKGKRKCACLITGKESSSGVVRAGEFPVTLRELRREEKGNAQKQRRCKRRQVPRGGGGGNLRKEKSQKHKGMFPLR